MDSAAPRGAKDAGQNLSLKAGRKEKKAADPEVEMAKEEQGPPEGGPPKGPMWAIHKGVWPGRVLKQPNQKTGVIVHPGLQYKNIHHAATYVVKWEGESELVEVKWEDIEKWLTDRFCTKSPWVLKSILAYQKLNWHKPSAEGERLFNVDKVQTLKERKLKEKVWRDAKNKVKSEKFREDASTTLTPSGDFYYLVEQELREADILAAKGTRGNGSCSGGSSGAGVKEGRQNGKAGSADCRQAAGVEVKAEQIGSAVDGEETEDEEMEDEEVDEEDAQREWTETCWTGNRYPAELAFVLGDKTVAETLAEEEADRLAGKPEPEFVVERVMDELRVEVEGLKAPVKYFLVKWEGYELDVQSGLNSDTFGNSWLTEGKLRSNNMAKAWKRSQPGWWLRQQ